MLTGCCSHRLGGGAKDKQVSGCACCREARGGEFGKYQGCGVVVNPYHSTYPVIADDNAIFRGHFVGPLFELFRGMDRKKPGSGKYIPFLTFQRALCLCIRFPKLLLLLYRELDLDV